MFWIINSSEIKSKILILRKKNEIATTPEYNEEYFKEKFKTLLDDIKSVQSKYIEYNKELKNEKDICKENFEKRQDQLKHLNMYLNEQTIRFADLKDKDPKKKSLFSKFKSLFGSRN